MSKDGEGSSSTVTVPIDDSHEPKTRAAAAVPLPPGPNAPKGVAVGPFARMRRVAGARGGSISCLAFLDLVVRLFAIGGAFAGTALMATNYETLPFFTQVFQFHTSFNDFDALTFFIIGTSIVGGYLVLSLILSIIAILRPRHGGLRLVLLIFDTLMLNAITTSAAAAAAIVYLAHTGNRSANWIAMCQQFNNFCQRSSGAVVSAFVASLLLTVLVIMSGMILRKQH